MLTTSSAEVRVVHTHSVVSGSYEIQDLANPEKKKSLISKMRNASADLDSGIGKVPMLIRNDLSRTYA
jgi:hypothetical protein